MKKQLLFAAPLMVAVGAFAQGTVNFQNRVPGSLTGPQGSIQAPVYGVQPGDIGREIHGQSAAGIPAGTTVYGGALLNGTGFTAQLWGGPGTQNDPALLQLCTTPAGTATTTFRTGTTTIGYITALADAPTVPGAPAGTGSRPNLQVRAWDNQNGTVTSWAQVMNNQTIPHGDSGIFQPGFDLGGGTVLPPNLIGMTSFNLHAVPEPSLIALGALGLGALLLRRRKA